MPVAAVTNCRNDDRRTSARSTTARSRRCSAAGWCWSTKLEIVLNASVGSMLPMPSGLSGSTCCSDTIGECRQPHHDVRGQQRHRVPLPVLLVRGIDAGDAQDQPLDRHEHGIEQRPAAREHAGTCTGRAAALVPIVKRMVKTTAMYSVPMAASEFLRAQHRVDQVDEGGDAQQQRQYRHGVPTPVAEPDEREHRGKRREPEDDHSQQQQSPPTRRLTCCRTTTPGRPERCSDGDAGHRARQPVKNGSFDQSRRNSPRSRNPSANLYSSGGGQLLQHLIDAAEQSFVVEPFVAHRQAAGRGDLVARVDAEPCSDSASSPLFTSLVT